MSYPLHEDYRNYLIEIEQDRYHGTHSGHLYTAWRGVRPQHINGSESVCQAFWEDEAQWSTYGGGNTPQEAFKDLVVKLLAQGVGIYDPDFVLVSPLRVIVILSAFDESDIIPIESDKFKEWAKDLFTKTP